MAKQSRVGEQGVGQPEGVGLDEAVEESRLAPELLADSMPLLKRGLAHGVGIVEAWHQLELLVRERVERCQQREEVGRFGGREDHRDIEQAN